MNTPITIGLIVGFSLGFLLGILTYRFILSRRRSEEPSNLTKVLPITDLPGPILNQTIERISKVTNRSERLNLCLSSLLEEQKRRAGRKTPEVRTISEKPKP